MIGNKTQCDICSAKALRKARVKKEPKDAISTGDEQSEQIDESVSPSTLAPTPTGTHHSTHHEGIFNQKR